MSFESNLSPAAFTPEAPTTATAGRAFVDVQEGTALLALNASDTPAARSLTFTLPSSYAGGTITLRLPIAAASAIEGNVKLNAQWRRMNDAMNRSFAAAQTATIARGATPNAIQQLEITFTSAQIDGATAGMDVQLRLTRDNAVGTNAAGNIWVVNAHISEG